MAERSGFNIRYFHITRQEAMDLEFAESFLHGSEQSEKQELSLSRKVEDI